MVCVQFPAMTEFIFQTSTAEGSTSSRIIGTRYFVRVARTLSGTSEAMPRPPHVVIPGYSLLLLCAVPIGAGAPSLHKHLSYVFFDNSTTDCLSRHSVKPSSSIYFCKKANLNVHKIQLFPCPLECLSLSRLYLDSHK